MTWRVRIIAISENTDFTNFADFHQALDPGSSPAETQR
jgi:hypothetical protein